MLLGVPNFSEGRDERRVGLIAAQFAHGTELLDRHSDPVHNRSVLNLRAPSAGLLGQALVRGAGACSVTIDMRRHQGAHPCVGALDVCPLVYTDAADREPAAETAREVAAAIAADGVPVFLYGELAASEERRERAFFRSGGLRALAARMASGELEPDLGPPEPHPSAGATLITARPPLAAFNLVLTGASIDAARDIAARLRESGGGLPGVRAIAVDLGEAGVQVSTNVHDPIAVPLAAVVERTKALAEEHRARVAAAEIVGLVAAAALTGLPDDPPLPGFEPGRRVIENISG